MAAGVQGCHHLCHLGIPPYLKGLLKRGLNKGETQDLISPITKEGMMFTSAVRLELLFGLNDAYNMVDTKEGE
jgi:hypothetical protein